MLTLEAAKGIAVATWKFLVDKDYAIAVKKEFEEMRRGL